MEKTDPETCVLCGSPAVDAPRISVRQEHALSMRPSPIASRSAGRTATSCAPATAPRSGSFMPGPPAPTRTSTGTSASSSVPSCAASPATRPCTRPTRPPRRSPVPRAARRTGSGARSGIRWPCASTPLADAPASPPVAAATDARPRSRARGGPSRHVRVDCPPRGKHLREPRARVRAVLPGWHVDCDGGSCRRRGLRLAPPMTKGGVGRGAPGPAAIGGQCGRRTPTPAAAS
jgi:hypothetical protein